MFNSSIRPGAVIFLALYGSALFLVGFMVGTLIWLSI